MWAGKQQPLPIDYRERPSTWHSPFSHYVWTSGDARPRKHGLLPIHRSAWVQQQLYFQLYGGLRAQGKRCHSVCWLGTVDSPSPSLWRYSDTESLRCASRVWGALNTTISLSVGHSQRTWDVLGSLCLVPGIKQWAKWDLGTVFMMAQSRWELP